MHAASTGQCRLLSFQKYSSSRPQGECAVSVAMSNCWSKVGIAQLVLHFRGSSLWYAQGSNLCYVNDIALICSSKTCSVDTATKLIAIDLHSPSTGYLELPKGDFCAVKNAIAVHVQLTWRVLVSVIVNAGRVKRSGE